MKWIVPSWEEWVRQEKTTNTKDIRSSLGLWWQWKICVIINFINHQPTLHSTFSKPLSFARIFQVYGVRRGLQSHVSFIFKNKAWMLQTLTVEVTAYLKIMVIKSLFKMQKKCSNEIQCWIRLPQIFLLFLPLNKISWSHFQQFYFWLQITSSKNWNKPSFFLLVFQWRKCFFFQILTRKYDDKLSLMIKMFIFFKMQ